MTRSPSSIPSKKGYALGLLVKQGRLDKVKKTIESTLPIQKGYDQILLYDPQGKKSDYVRWLGREKRWYPQKGRFLGEKLKNAFKDLLKKYQRVIIMGCDKPSVTEAYLREAFAALEEKEVVLGPLSEGGYYLIGLKKNLPEIFERALWNTPFVFDTTLKVLEGLEIEPYLLPILTY